jgi:23S rRNA (cytosine1962-C5)-methyltransferase
VSAALLARAIARREKLLGQLEAEETDCYRLFHGIAEGRPGLAVDRYGPILLFQTWREPLERGELESLHRAACGRLSRELHPVWNHRAKERNVPFSRFHDPQLSESPEGRELGLVYDVRPRHRGLDPLLFLDLRAARRRIRSAARGLSVLNLFAYTCGMSVAAAAGGAREVWSVDFSGRALSIGRRNLERNGLSVSEESHRAIAEDVFAVARQLAGLPVASRRRGVLRRFERFEPRTFDVVVLDPPRWSKGPLGAVDVVRDYPSLLKPALLAAAPGGRVLATNHAPEVSREDWVRVLKRTGEKCGRPLGNVEILEPEADFPSFDGAPPLKVAWFEV